MKICGKFRQVFLRKQSFFQHIPHSIKVNVSLSFICCVITSMMKKNGFPVNWDNTIPFYLLIVTTVLLAACKKKNSGNYCDNCFHYLGCSFKYSFLDFISFL